MHAARKTINAGRYGPCAAVATGRKGRKCAITTTSVNNWKKPWKHFKNKTQTEREVERERLKKIQIEKKRYNNNNVTKQKKTKSYHIKEGREKGRNHFRHYQHRIQLKWLSRRLLAGNDTSATINVNLPSLLVVIKVNLIMTVKNNSRNGRQRSSNDTATSSGVIRIHMALDSTPTGHWKMARASIVSHQSGYWVRWGEGGAEMQDRAAVIGSGEPGDFLPANGGSDTTPHFSHPRPDSNLSLLNQWRAGQLMPDSGGELSRSLHSNQLIIE